MASTKQLSPEMELFCHQLRRYSLKATNQRLSVHQAMLKLGHASADMVTEEIQKAGTAKVTTASVYNILSQLALIGIYQHRLSLNSKMYFDVNTFPHAHLYDISNNKHIDVLDDELIAMIKARLGKKRFKGYKVEGFDLQILCRQTKRRAVKQ